jgi:hypothetical protein
MLEKMRTIQVGPSEFGQEINLIQVEDIVSIRILLPDSSGLPDQSGRS